MTLVELLVVVGIAVLLLGMAVPMMRPAIEEGRVREASRQLVTYFALAKARAAESGRPVGVLIERSIREPFVAYLSDYDFSQQLFIAETPLPYAGDLFTSKARRNPSLTANQIELTFSPSLPTIVKAGDYIKFDYRGLTYQIATVAPLTSDPMYVELAANSPPLPPIPSSPALGVPFQIFRQPEKSMLTPLQLGGIVGIDLQNSGHGATGLQFAASYATGTARTLIANNPVMIVFTPSGRVAYVQYGGQIDTNPGTIYLLVGRRDRQADPTASMGGGGELELSSTDNTLVPYSQNLADNSNTWVAVGSQSGSVITAENAWEIPAATPYFENTLVFARQYARTASPRGGL